MELIQPIPNPWKKDTIHDNGNCKNLLLLNYYLIKNDKLHDVEKVRILYLFNSLWCAIGASNIYSLPWIVMIDSELR